MNWKDCFRYFIEAELKEDGKTKPKGKTKGSGCHPLTFEEAEEKELFGGILKEDLICISFDDAEMFKRFLKMREVNHWNCVVCENPTNGHGQTIWKNSSHRIKIKSGADKKTAVGMIVDVHGGYTIIRLKEPTHNRFPPVFVPEGELDEVPDELMLVNTKKDLWKMRDGDGRDSELFSYIQVLQNQLFLTNDRIKHIIRNINEFIFDDALTEDDIERITREEAFQKYEVQPLESISAFDLMNMNLEPVYFCVEEFLPMGLSIIASPPKFGKSFFCTQLSIAVANGEDFLGFKTNRSGVLYLALEDSQNRCKERLIQELQGKEAPKNFEMVINAPTIGTGLIEQLQEYINGHPDVKLIIIDTFQKIRDGSKSNEGSYASDYRETGAMKKFADENKIAVLLVHHTRKMKDPSDAFANVSGTQGLTGASDTMIVLSKEKRTDSLTRLSITGRDVVQNEYGISRNPDSVLWMRYEESIETLQMKIETSMIQYQYKNSNFRKTVLKLLEEENQWSGRCGELITASKEFGTPITETAQKLARMIDDYNPFMISDDKIYHTVINNGTGSKIHRFEKSS